MFEDALIITDPSSGLPAYSDTALVTVALVTVTVKLQWHILWSKMGSSYTEIFRIEWNMLTEIALAVPAVQVCPLTVTSSGRGKSVTVSECHSNQWFIVYGDQNFDRKAVTVSGQASTGLPDYSDTIRTREKCHCKRVSLKPAIFSTGLGICSRTWVGLTLIWNVPSSCLGSR